MFACPNECVLNKGEIFRQRSCYQADVTRERKNLTGVKLDAVVVVSLPTVRLIPRGLLSHFDPSVWEINSSQRLETSRGQVSGGPCFRVSAENRMFRGVAGVRVDLSSACVTAPQGSVETLKSVLLEKGNGDSFTGNSLII